MTDETQTHDDDLGLEEKLILIIQFDIFVIALVLAYAAGWRDNAKSIIDWSNEAAYANHLLVRQTVGLPSWIDPTVSALTAVLFIATGSLLVVMWRNGTVEEALENMKQFGADG